MKTLKVKEYKMLMVLEDEYPYTGDEFSVLVNNFINEGWVLFGGPFFRTDAGCVFFVQAIILPVDESEAKS